jgi:hypothetical protein
MNALALVLVVCLPYTGQCKSIIQRPAPTTHEECNDRAVKLQRTLAGSIDDAGYRPVQVTCVYGGSETEAE